MLAPAQEPHSEVRIRRGEHFGDVEPVIGRLRKREVSNGRRPGRDVQALTQCALHGIPRDADLFGGLDHGLEFHGVGQRVALNLLGPCQHLSYVLVLESH
jgi:hypothetical protein